MPDRRASRQRLKSLSEVELRALAEAHERKIEALLSAPSRRLAGWLRGLLAPLSFGRMRPLQSADEYFARVDASVLRRGSPAPRKLPPPELPNLPADIPGFWARASLAEAVSLIDRLLAVHDHRSLFLLLDTPAAAGSSDRAIVEGYAWTLLNHQQRIFSDAVAAASPLLAGDGIAERLGARAHLAVMLAVAHSLARLGRLDEARATVDAALAKFPGEGGLYRQRAEIVWPQDPAAAIADLEAAAEAENPAPEARLLRHRLLSEREGFDHARARRDEEEHFWRLGKELPRDFHLAFANAALAAGDVVAQRAEFDRFFALQGLEPPIGEAWKPASFGNLGNPGLPRAPDGPLVSVVMTAFNSEATIAGAIRSVLHQTYQKFELIVVDDASADSTARVVEAIAAGDGRVRLLRNARNSGTYVSKNRALAEAKGAFFTCQDSDDWCHPERLARHVAFMADNPRLVASRSLLIRMSEAGAISMKRWGARFAHLNPASAFCRMSVREEIGYFDSVRVGADSEHWFRLRNRFGPAAVATLPLTLTIALHHDKSLTRFGAGALDEAGHSPVREEYQREWLAWHRRQAQSRDLHLPPHQAERRFPVPAEIAVPEPPGAASEEPSMIASVAAVPASHAKEVVFGISLAARASVADWDRVSLLLRSTLRSVLGQGDPRLRVIICGHDRPALPELDDPRVEFLLSDQPPPLEPRGFRRDKMRKRRLIGVRLRQLGGGYLFPLDADDMVSRRLVGHVLSDDNRRGYSLTQGYALDWRNRRLAPVPGAWDATYDRVCGSSAVICFGAEDLPAAPEETGPQTYFDLFGEHAYWPIVAEECGRPLAKIPFPAGIYVVNHAENLSFRLQRTALRQANIAAAIAAHADPHHPGDRRGIRLARRPCGERQRGRLAPAPVVPEPSIPRPPCGHLFKMKQAP